MRFAAAESPAFTKSIQWLTLVLFDIREGRQMQNGRGIAFEALNPTTFSVGVELGVARPDGVRSLTSFNFELRILLVMERPPCVPVHLKCMPGGLIRVQCRFVWVLVAKPIPELGRDVSQVGQSRS